MNNGLLDMAVILGALGLGGYVAVVDNPLTASIVFLCALGMWELVKALPLLLGKQNGAKSH